MPLLACGAPLRSICAIARPCRPWGWDFKATPSSAGDDAVTSLIAESVPARFYVGAMVDFPVDIVRSQRRKRTVQARLTDGRIKVMVPAGMDPEEESRVVDSLVKRVKRKASSAKVDLAKRVAILSDEYDLPLPAGVEWSARQNRIWGSCTPGDERIRVSNRLATMPLWVLDYVLIHEMAHLDVPDHGPRFRELLNRYELAERATGYLMAVGALEARGGDAFEPPEIGAIG